MATHGRAPLPLESFPVLVSPSLNTFHFTSPFCPPDSFFNSVRFILRFRGTRTLQLCDDIIVVICINGINYSKTWLKATIIFCSRFWADSVVWVQLGAFPAPRGIQAHWCICGELGYRWRTPGLRVFMHSEPLCTSPGSSGDVQSGWGCWNSPLRDLSLHLVSRPHWDQPRLAPKG